MDGVYSILVFICFLMVWSRISKQFCNYFHNIVSTTRNKLIVEMYFLIVGVVFILIFALIIKLYMKTTHAFCGNFTCLVGKTVIITGANRGLGYETAKNLAKRGARVILACRTIATAENACKKLIAETNNDNIVFKQIDFKSFKSIRLFAKQIIATENRLDLLINNAGIAIGSNESRVKTEDGYTEIMQVNYLSSFLLTYLLLDLMSKTGGRIVNVSSSGALLARNFTPEVLSEAPKHWTLQYCDSKLCNILFTQELNRKLSGTDITAYSLHPGIIFSGLHDIIPIIYRYFIYLIFSSFTVTREEGAQTIIYCATQKGIEKYSGEHFHNCKRVTPYWNARNDNLAQALWQKTEKILNLCD